MFKLGIGNDGFSGISGGLSGVSMCGIVRVPFYDDYLYIYSPEVQLSKYRWI